MAAVQLPTDTAYFGLLSLAEEFLNIPDLKRSTQCLVAILDINGLHPKLEAKTALQLGNIIYRHTTNMDWAKFYLEKAYHSQHLEADDPIKLEAGSLLADYYDKQGQSHFAKEILKKCVVDSEKNLFWHIRLLFQVAQVHAHDREYDAAANWLSAGSEYASINGAAYTRILFLLSKGMMLMISRRLQEGYQVLTLAGQLVESWHGNFHQKEALKIFFLILQVCHHLNAGQVKSVKPCLKILQQSIQNITTYQHQDANPPLSPHDMFIWMSKDQMCVLVYLVTVLHSMQAGYMDKAQKYTEKALLTIDKLKNGIEDHPILSAFQILLLEHMAMCRLVLGNKTLAVKETVQALNICYRGEPRLKIRHRPVIQTLLGLYAMGTNNLDAAVAQFNSVVQSQNGTNNQDLRTLASLNLAIVFMRCGPQREKELNEVLMKVNPEGLPTTSQSLKAAAYYVYGLNAFFGGRYNDAKRYLRETLKMANAEDLNRLTSCSLVLLGHIFYSLGNSRESMNMVTPAMQLASKIPDIHVQLWATALLKDLYHQFGDHARQQEAMTMHHTFQQTLLTDQYQAQSLPQHQTIFHSL